MLKPEQTLMFKEASEAAAVVEHQLKYTQETVTELGSILRDTKPRLAMTVARGSSDHAGVYLKYLLQTELGIPVISASPSINSLYGAALALDGTVCFAISQSGKSPDICAAARAAKKSGARVIALVNVEDSPLADLADHVLPLHAGPEISVAATKSFIASLTMSLAVVAHWRSNSAALSDLLALPDLLGKAWACDWSAAHSPLAERKGAFMIARGLGYGVAREAALKLKETCAIHAEAYSAAEVMHGPAELVREGFPVLALGQPDPTQQSVSDVSEKLAQIGGNVHTAGFRANGLVELETVPGSHLTTPILAIQSFYRMANALAVKLGRNPDTPSNLKKVTETL